MRLPETARAAIGSEMRGVDLTQWARVAALTHQVVQRLAALEPAMGWGYLPHPDGHEDVLALKRADGSILAWDYVLGAGAAGASISWDAESVTYDSGSYQARTFIAGTDISPEPAPSVPTPPPAEPSAPPPPPVCQYSPTDVAALRAEIRDLTALVAVLVPAIQDLAEQQAIEWPEYVGKVLWSNVVLKPKKVLTVLG